MPPDEGTVGHNVALSLNGIRDRARAFSERFKDASSEDAESQTFWNELFAVFDIDRKQVSTFEYRAERTSTGGTGRVDLLWPGEMAVEQKSRGVDLDGAMDQAIDYLDSLSKAELPWLIVVSDFETMRWRDLRDNSVGGFLVADLADHVEMFAWMAGHRRPNEEIKPEEEVNLEATALLAEIHDHLAENGFAGHELRVWLTRILFCLFADDTGVFEKAAFHSYISARTAEDGSDLGQAVSYIFQWLDTDPSDRPNNLNEQLAALPHVNGDLFEEVLRIPACDEAVRDALLEACKFDWAHISPAIFGSMFQGVMAPAERRQIGAHYTSERDILRTIRPLFVDKLERQLAASNTRPTLNAFLSELRQLEFMDPACGCGNFLVIAYRELRKLEAAGLRKLRERLDTADAQSLDVTMELQVNVDQFCGIEIEEFPARIARTAMYLMDHLANREASKEFGRQILRFPITASPRIVVGNALTLDWSDVFDFRAKAYVFGNPPFVGHSTRSTEQADELKFLWQDGYSKWLDYVTGWYQKAISFGRGRDVEFAFVSTSSICQGEQVARLWDPLFEEGFGITFAYQPFDWISEARGGAHVHVVIVGMARGEGVARELFEFASARAEPTSRAVRTISPYLVEGPEVAVSGRRDPISPLMPTVSYGSLPRIGAGLIITTEEELPTDDPVAMSYIKPYLGSREVVNGLMRWCIWAPDGLEPGDRRRSPFLTARLAQVRAEREASTIPVVRDVLALQPTKFFHNGQPTTNYIGIPAQVSANRRWYTVAYFSPDFIASNTLYTASDPTGFLFALLSSSMMMVWIRVVGGSIRADPRYAKSIVHNTFPLPTRISDTNRASIIEAGAELLRVREGYPDASLADLYDPDAPRADLIAAHAGVDRAVDRMFSPRRNRWTSDNRLSHLLERYSTMIGAEAN